MEPIQRVFRTDRLKIERLRILAGLTFEKFSTDVDLDKGTARKFVKGAPVSLETLMVASNFFGISNYLELLHPDELIALGVNPDAAVTTENVQEWKIETFLTPWEKTANGLQFHTARLRHQFLTDRLARGKCFELRHLPVTERKRLEEQLRRHPEVCERIRDHPNLAKNITATPTENGGLWWVLDRYEEGITLAERIAEGPLEGRTLKEVIVGIANGLDTLHRKGVVRRELSPRFVLLKAKSYSPVLTDFELAKLLDGAPTVSPTNGWPDDPYIAPEVLSRGTVDERADLYSWGRVFAHALLGHLPEPGADAAGVRTSALPSKIREILVSCLSLPSSDRPASMAEVQKTIKKW